jgi:hypothetical protein
MSQTFSAGAGGDPGNARLSPEEWQDFIEDLRNIDDDFENGDDGRGPRLSAVTRHRKKIRRAERRKAVMKRILEHLIHVCVSPFFMEVTTGLCNESHWLADEGDHNKASALCAYHSTQIEGHRREMHQIVDDAVATFLAGSPDEDKWFAIEEKIQEELYKLDVRIWHEVDHLLKACPSIHVPPELFGRICGYL